MLSVNQPLPVPPAQISFASLPPSGAEQRMFETHLETLPQTPTIGGDKVVQPNRGKVPEDTAAEAAALLAAIGALSTLRRGQGAQQGASQQGGTLQEITDPAVLESIVGAGPAQGPSAAASLPAPVPATAANQAIGDLSHELGMILNPALRRIIADIKSDVAPIGHFNTEDATPEATAAQALHDGGLDAGRAVAMAPNLVTLAAAMNVDVAALAPRLFGAIQDARGIIAEHGPQNPVLVNTALDPNSIDLGIRYATALLSDGVKVPPGTYPVTTEEGTHDVAEGKKLVPAASFQDIDGVSKEAPPVLKGVDVRVTTQPDDVQHLHIRLLDDFVGTPTRVAGVTSTPQGPQARIELQEGGHVDAPVSAEKAAVLASSTSAPARYVDGIAGRSFPEDAKEFLKEASRTTIKDSVMPTVAANNIVLITFGPAGERAFASSEPDLEKRESPSNLNTCLARALSPAETREPIPPGLLGAPGVKVYSGGASITHTSEGKVLEPFGLTAEQGTGVAVMAAKLPALVQEMSKQYGLSKGALSDNLDLTFGRDIPSVILSTQGIAELRAKTAPNDPEGAFPKFQKEMTQRLGALIVEHGLQESHLVHMTPSAPVAPGEAEKPLLYTGTGEFTTEWQMAASGQKTVPTMAAFLDHLKSTRRIDLEPELASLGASYTEIRKLTRPQMTELCANVIKPLADLHMYGGDLASALRQAPGGPIELADLQQMSLPQIGALLRDRQVLTFPVSVARAAQERAGDLRFPEQESHLMPHLIVAADTIKQNADGTLGGSDASMMDPAAALFTPARTHLFMVDTLAGKAGTSGRNPAFTTAIDPDTSKLQVVKRAIDPDGPSGNKAPSAYITTQAEFGTIFNEALRAQAALTPDELRVHA